MLKNELGLAEPQEKATYVLGYKVTLTRNKVEAVLDKTAGIAHAKINIDHIHWCVPHHAPSIQQHGTLSKQILSKSPTEIKFFERPVFMEEVNKQNIWNFEIGIQENMNVPLRIIIGFQPRDRHDSKNLKNDTFCRLPVTSAQCVSGTEKTP